MTKRYLSIWFPCLLLDWTLRRYPAHAHAPFALVITEKGQGQVVMANALASQMGVATGMTLADSRAICPDLEIMDYPFHQLETLIKAWAAWAIRYTPLSAIDPPEGIVLDISGCAHLWAGESTYLNTIVHRIQSMGYKARGAIADTIGAAWALSRYGPSDQFVYQENHKAVLASLPVSALRIEDSTRNRLSQLGIKEIRHLMKIDRPALRRRLGAQVLTRLDQLWGSQWEGITAYQPESPYLERLASLDPISTARGIRIALEKLLARLSHRMEKENKGMRQAKLSCYRVDGQMQQVSISMSNPSRDPQHLRTLFLDRLSEIRPGLGIELFVLDAPIVEPLEHSPSLLWTQENRGDQAAISALLDRVSSKIGPDRLHRYMPTGRHWPEHSLRPAVSLQENPAWPWPVNLPRPIRILNPPEPIEVSAPMPDHPPLLFRFRGKGFQVVRSEGPERIESEWWQSPGFYRDYYGVEDPQGIRYWLFRLGDTKSSKALWFLHGWFA